MTETTGTKTLAAMTAEVTDLARDKGQYEAPVSFGEAMAGLHAGASKALESWRQWALADMTYTKKLGPGNLLYRTDDNAWISRPEGTGAEFAGILITLLGACRRFGDVDLGDWVSMHPERYAVSASFSKNVNMLHDLISEASVASSWIDDEYKDAFAGIYVFLAQLCETYGIDLAAEFERSMTWLRAQPAPAGAAPEGAS